MATKVQNVKLTTHIKFTKDGKFLGVPQALIEKALKVQINDDMRPFWFRVSLLQNNGLQVVLLPMAHPDKAKKPFKGWKSNRESRRYYISAVALLGNLKYKGTNLLEVSLPATVKDGKILAALPVSVRQVQ